MADEPAPAGRLDAVAAPGPPAWRRLLPRAALVTAPLVVVLLLRVPHLDLALRLWLSLLAAVGVGELVERMLRRQRVADPVRPWAGLRWGWWRRRRREPVRPLEELERAVEFSLGTAFDVHYRLRPHLRRVALHRLAARGVSLDAQPERARELLGPLAWDLVRPGRAEPEDRAGPGMGLDAVREVVERLAALAPGGEPSEGEEGRPWRS